MSRGSDYGFSDVHKRPPIMVDSILRNWSRVVNLLMLMASPIKERKIMPKLPMELLFAQIAHV